MEVEIFKGEYKGIKFRYSIQDKEEKTGVLIVNLSNGIESTHTIKQWGVIRVMQYIESMTNLV
jgi:hypothetical protein